MNKKTAKNFLKVFIISSILGCFILAGKINADNKGWLNQILGIVKYTTNGNTTIDSTIKKPECTPSTCFNPNITVSCSADYEIRYTTGSADPSCNTGSEENPIRSSNQTFNSETTLKVIACDGKNSSDIVKFSYYKDTSAPSIPNIMTEPTHTKGTSNTIYTYTPDDSGCPLTQTTQYQFCKSETNNTDNCNDQNANDRDASGFKIFSNLSDGTQYYYFVKAKDSAGNVSNWSSGTYSTQDDSGPSISFTSESGAAETDHGVVVTAHDNISKLAGLQKIKYRRQTGSDCSTIESEYTETIATLYPQNGGTENASVTVTTPSNLADGSYYLCILADTVSDQVGNKNNAARTNGVFIIQNSVLSVSATNSSDVWKSGSIEITLNVSPSTNLTYAKYSRTSANHCINNGTDFTDGQTITHSTEGEETLYLCAQDNSNQTATRSGVYKLDSTPPSCKISADPTEPTNGNVTLNAKVTETNKDKYSWTGWDDLVTTNTIFVTGENGTRTFYVQDKAGNRGTCDITISNINNTQPDAPTCTESACYSGSITVICSTSSSDITVKYTENQRTPPNCKSSKEWQNQTFDTTRTLNVIACDKVGNKSEVKTYTYTKDTRGPTGSIVASGGVSINGIKHYSGLTIPLTLNATDVGCSTVDKVQFSCDGESRSSLYDYSNTTTWTLGDSYGCSTQDGEKAIYARYIDTLGNVGEEYYVKIKIDRTPPQIPHPGTFQINECSTGTIVFNVSDNSSGNIVFVISGKDIEKCEGPSPLTCQYSKPYNDKGTYQIYFAGTDAVGNQTTGQSTITVSDVSLTGRDFRRELKKQGNSYVAEGNWKDLSRASVSNCENIRVSETSCNENATIVINGDEFTYTYTGKNGENLENVGNEELYCTFYLTDGDNTIRIKGSFKYCNSDNNDCNPTLYPKFISGDFYSYYDDKSNNYKKYTSGQNSVMVSIDIDGDALSEISGYRYSCIQADRYCVGLSAWLLCKNGYNNYSFCDLFNLFLSENNIQSPALCATETSRSDWKQYPTNGQFEIDLSGDCKHSNELPYQSKYQGTRQIRIQIMDNTGRVSTAIGTDIINYSTQSPTLQLEDGGSIRTINKNNDPANSSDFTINIRANGASLPNGLGGRNHNYIKSLYSKTFFELVRSSVLKNDEYNRLMMTIYDIKE